MHRLLRFRNELFQLWRAFLLPTTPLHIKAAMLLVPLYLLSPIDLIPDIIPLAGWLDDLIVVPILVSWIADLLRKSAPQPAPAKSSNGKTIDGTWRRL